MNAPFILGDSPDQLASFLASYLCYPPFAKSFPLPFILTLILTLTHRHLCHVVLYLERHHIHRVHRLQFDHISFSGSPLQTAKPIVTYRRQPCLPIRRSIFSSPGQTGGYIEFLGRVACPMMLRMNRGVPLSIRSLPLRSLACDRRHRVRRMACAIACAPAGGLCGTVLDYLSVEGVLSSIRPSTCECLWRDFQGRNDWLQVWAKGVKQGLAVYWPKRGIDRWYPCPLGYNSTGGDDRATDTRWELRIRRPKLVA